MSSKIKVDTIENVAGSGNVSLGSGHNLVVPGNITGSGTASITGDLTVDTSTLKVDATNNRVGIGVTSPSRKLELNNGGTGNLVTFTDGVATNFTFKTDGSNVGTFGTEAGSTHLAFMSSGTERMRIQTGGQIDYPFQPLAEAFYSNQSQDGAYGATNRNYVVCKPGGTHVNVGNMYNPSTGRFTVPVAGKYLAMVSGSHYNINVSGYHYVYIRKNNTSQKWIYNTIISGATWTELSGHTVFDCAANDFIDFFNQHDSSTTTNKGGWDINNYSKFTVMKIA